MKLLIILPDFDYVTYYSHLWGKRLIDQIVDKAEILLLQKEDATIDRFEDVIKRFDGDIVFYDHGTDDCLVGQDSRCVINVDNVKLASGRVIYTMACLSAKKLGKVAYSYNCIYVGYHDVFAFSLDEEELFCEAANSGIIAYVNGERDWKKIKGIMIDAFNNAIRKAKSIWSKMLLRWNRDALRVYADGVDDPEKDIGCLLRKLAVKCFRKTGYRIKRRTAITIALVLSIILLYFKQII